MYPASEKLEIIKIVEQSSSARRWFSLVCLTRGCIHLSVNRTPMSLLRSSAMVLPRQLAPVLKTYLSPQALKTLLIRSSADRGRERYRRAGMTAFTSYIAKGLTLSWVSFRAAYGSLPRRGAIRRVADLKQPSALGGPDRFWSRRQRVGECAVGGGRKRRPGSARHYAASAFWALCTIALGHWSCFIAAFHSIPWRAVFRVSDAASTQELESTCALVLMLFVIDLPLGLLRSLYNAATRKAIWRIYGASCTALFRWLARWL